MRKLLKEPLFHFLALGVALFVVFGMFGNRDFSDTSVVRITEEDINRIAATWEVQWRRPPTPQELSGLVKQHIREELLFREAMALGLEKDDIIVRRRLVQKMEFLSEDLAVQQPPSEEELQAFFADNQDLFQLPARVSLTHVYFSRDRRGEKAEQDAKAALGELGKNGDADTASLGDRFMLQRHYAQRTEQDLSQLFGRDFAASVFTLEPQLWQGPVESGYGLHLVRVEERIEARFPELSEVRKDVEMELVAKLRKDANELFYLSLRERYDIEVEGFGVEQADAGDLSAEPEAAR